MSHRMSQPFWKRFSKQFGWASGLLPAALAVPLLLPPHANAQSVTWEGGTPLRSDTRFAYDSGTSDGFWIESRLLYRRDEEEVDVYSYSYYSVYRSTIDVDVDYVSAEDRFVWGFDYGELGFMVPYRWRQTDYEYSREDDEDGLGDIEIWGKGVYRSPRIGPGWQLEAGAGVNFSVPSHTEDAFGRDDPVVDAFATFGVHLGPAALRAHVGHSWDPDIDEYDNVLWGVGLHGSVGRWIALRAEFIGRHFYDLSDLWWLEDADEDIVTFEPGVDLRIASIRSFNLIFRLSGSVGLTDDTPDGGVGGSIVFNFDPFETH
ncbi:MAG: hypothetical protein ACQGVK_00660 [Myxococcota bacterium]